MRKVLLAFLSLALTLFAVAQPGGLDNTFNPADLGYYHGDGANGAVRAIAVQPDGKIWIGGEFTTYNKYAVNRVMRLESNGRSDGLHNYMTSRANGTVYSITVQSNSLTLVGGDFTNYDGDFYSDYLAQLGSSENFNTGLTPHFDPGAGPDGIVRAIALQSDGKIIIGGDFSSYNGHPHSSIARLGSDGNLDPTFQTGTGANGSITSVVLQPDGKILIGGWFTEYNGTPRSRIARLNPNGSLDASFNPGSGPNGNIHSMVIQPNGKILIAGEFTDYNGSSRKYIARLNGNGSIDASFYPGSGANHPVHTILLQLDGKILAGGAFTSYNGAHCNYLARLNSSGTLDASLNPGSGPNGVIYALALQPDGKILIGGNFGSYNGFTSNHLARLYPDGTFDTSLNPVSGASNRVSSITLQRDEKILIGGDFTVYNGTRRHRIARLLPDGLLDNSFDPGSGADATIQATVIQPDDKILIAGAFTSYNGTTRNRVARLNGDGSLDASFDLGEGTNNSIYALALQPDGKILIGGDFTAYHTTTRNRIARLNTDGSLDDSFDPGEGANGTITAVIVQSDGKILISGDFTLYNGTGRNYIARLNGDGSLDEAFNPGNGPRGRVECMAVQPDGRILIGGGFTYYNGTIRKYLVRLNTDGSLDDSFSLGEGVIQNVYSIVILPDGRILAGGDLSLVNRVESSYIARLHPDGSLDNSFEGGADDVVHAIAVQNDGKVLVGGLFASYYTYGQGYTGRNRIARVQGGTNSITVGTVSPVTYCAGSTISVPFTTTGTFGTANTFHILLTDASGSAGAMYDMGYISTEGTDTISANIPPEIPGGNSYKIKVLSISPYVVSPASEAVLTIKALPDTPVVTVSGPITFCQGEHAVLTSAAASAYQWYKDSIAISGATGQSYTAGEAGSYTVTVSENGCTSSFSEPVVVSVATPPAKPVITPNGNILSSSSPTGNQWYKDGAAISGATGQQYVAQEPGQYTVKVTQSWCSSVSDPYNFIVTALEDLVSWNGEVTVYPVPVQDHLYLTNKGNRKLTVQVMDVMGKKVREFSFATSSVSLPMNGLAPGTYLLLITDVRKAETISRTIVKQ